MSKKESLAAPGRCFVCTPEPLPEPYCVNLVEGPNIASFMTGLAYGLVILGYREGGTGLCAYHRVIVDQGLDAICEELDELDAEETLNERRTEPPPPAN